MQSLNENNFDEMVLDTKIPIRLAYIKPNGAPAILSLWYIQIEGKIFCATQKNARIVSYLIKNPRCGFEIAGDKPPYKGTRGEGIAKIIESLGPSTLDLLIEKYLGGRDSTLSRFLKQNSENEVAIQISPKKIFNYDYSKRMRDI